MAFHFVNNPLLDKSKLSVFFLALFWCFFLSLGTTVGYYVELDFSLMPGNSSIASSIVALFLIRFLPLVISIVAIRINCLFFIYLSAAGRSFCFGYLLSVYISSFHCAAWIFFLLDYFSTSLLNVFLLIIWLNNYTKVHNRICFFGICFCVLLSLWDLFIISPFVSSLIIFT